MTSEKITSKVVEKVADLIKIFIPRAELEKYSNQLNTVLGSVEVMDELDVEETEITSQTHGLTNILREDVIKEGLNMSSYKNTENFKDGYFVVDKVL